MLLFDTTPILFFIGFKKEAIGYDGSTCVVGSSPTRGSTAYSQCITSRCQRILLSLGLDQFWQSDKSHEVKARCSNILVTRGHGQAFHKQTMAWPVAKLRTEPCAATPLKNTAVNGDRLLSFNLLLQPLQRLFADSNGRCNVWFLWRPAFWIFLANRPCPVKKDIRIIGSFGRDQQRAFEYHLWSKAEPEGAFHLMYLVQAHIRNREFENLTWLESLRLGVDICDFLILCSPLREAL